ncbi:transposase [Ilyonectria robusta]
MSTNLRSFGTIISANRQGKQRTKPELRAAIIAAVQAGEARSTVATRFGVSTATISRLLQRLETTASIDPKPQSGRPPSLTPRAKRAIIHAVRQDERVSRKDLLDDLSLEVSATTVRRALNEASLRKWKARKRIFLRKEDAAQRLQFSRNWAKREEELSELVCSLWNWYLHYARSGQGGGARSPVARLVEPHFTLAVTPLWWYISLHEL